MMHSVREVGGRWIDTSVFREEAIRYMGEGYYTSHPFGSPDWERYWQEQLDRCRYGYSVGGIKITGHHYFYLNFVEINALKSIHDAGGGKVRRFPDFWDSDYDYFWSLEISRDGLYREGSLVETYAYEREEFLKLDSMLVGLDERSADYSSIKRDRDAISLAVLGRLGLRVKPHLDYLKGDNHFIVGKSRRKGYSFKNAAICTNVYNTEKNRQIIIGAEKSRYLYPTGTMSMVSGNMDFLNSNTGWVKSRDVIDTRTHKRASYKEASGGRYVEKGYKSEVFAITFNADPDAARGKDARLVLLEEAGDFSNLGDAYNAIYPSLTAGRFLTGQIIIFGTGGSMEDANADYITMFYNPMEYRLMPFENIWDEGKHGTYCGYFHPVNHNMEGFYDDNGNSDVEGARAYELSLRSSMLSKASSMSVLHKHVQEYPLSPSEAFLVTHHSPFPLEELVRQLNKVIAENLQRRQGINVTLSYDAGRVIARPDLHNRLDPVIHYPAKNADLTGCPIIYEYPVDNPPRGLYKVGYDPYRQEASGTTSLAAVYVYKGVHIHSTTKNTIVAEYVGRPDSSDDVNRIVMMLCELYNAECMHENEVTHVKNYFRHHKKLNLLAAQPDAVISANINNSRVARVYGIHMTEKLKDAGEKYIGDWLREVKDYDEDGAPLMNLNYIYSIGLLEELIKYNRKANTDRVMALMMCMFSIQEDDLGKEYGNRGDDNMRNILSVLRKNGRVSDGWDMIR